MNLLGGPKVGWRVILMFFCVAPNFVIILVFTKSSF